MIVLTAILVVSGFDWWYYSSTRALSNIGMSAGLLGFLIPVLLPVTLYALAEIKSNIRLKNAANASVQAGLLGIGLSSLIKVFTGRTGLPHMAVNLIDTSHMFRFGFMRGGAFQGWPSSHTSVAFAMSVAIVMLFPDKKWVRYTAVIYALYIGLGASVGFHWFSDFIAGIILGTVIGITVGKSFVDKITK